MPRKIFCLGYGYTARVLVRRLVREGWAATATARSAEKADALGQEGVTAALWTESGLDAGALADVDAILISTPPSGDGCPAFAAASGEIAASAERLSWIGYLSSNGVYGDHGGDWVDENSDLKPKSARARNRIFAEAQWAGFGAEWSLPFAIFRLPGIYGPERSALDAVREGSAKRILKSGQVFNRMHVDDIASALAASISNPRAGELFNLSDDEPAPPQDVVEYACRLLGAEPPPLVAIEQANLSEMGRSFYEENKRVRNDRMKEALGVRLRYPTYREGLRSIFEAGG